MNNTKTCSTCHTDKPYDAFALKTEGRRHSQCKECNNTRTRANYPNTREHHLVKVGARNKSIREHRMTMVRATQDHLPCVLCNSRVSTPRLRDAAHNQSSEQRWVDEITNVAWVCRQCGLSGVASNTVTHAMWRVLRSGAVTMFDLPQAVRELRPATDIEIDLALGELEEAGILYDDSPGWVQLEYLRPLLQ